MINSILIILVLSSIPPLSAKQLTKENPVAYGLLTEQNAIALALENNPNLAQNQARYDAMQNIPSLIGTLPDPMLTLEAMNFPTDSFDRSQEGMPNRPRMRRHCR